MIAVKIRMMGTLKEASGVAREVIHLDDSTPLSSLIERLVELHGDALRQTLLDPVLDTPQTNSLVLLNGVEVNNLQGLSTLVADGDEVVLLSVTHGG